MTDANSTTRRETLRTVTALATAGVGLGVTGTVAADSPDSTGAGAQNGTDDGGGPSFGRVYAEGVLWRTKVATVLEDRPDPEDKIYFLHDGEERIVANDDVTSAQKSPFVSESAPGDRDWNGGQWTHYSARVTDVTAFDADAPLTSAADVLEKEYVEVTLGRPGFGPPNYFVCPLVGRA